MRLNLKDQCVLVVDDYREMRITLRALLEALRAKSVLEAKSAEDALEQLGKQTVDVVLCDYNLGEGKDGQQLFEEARARQLLPAHAAWVMVTAENTMNMVMGVVENHPDGYLVKPVNKAVLQVRLERVIARKAVVKDIEAALAAGKLDAARALCDAQLVKYPPMRLDLLRLKTEALLRAGELEAASEICAGVLNERDLPWALLALARARYQAGDLRQAKTLFGRVIEQHETVMEAYDWLARTEREECNSAAAQRVVEQAIQRSPKSIRRQQQLGDLAQENKDYATAEKAYRRALAMGEDSCFARPADQAGLVDAVVGAKGPDAGLKVVQELAKRNRRRESHWLMALAEGRVLQAAGKTAAAAAAAARAVGGFKNDGSPAPEAALALAKLCFQTGIAAEAQVIIDKLVRENHDRDEVLAATRAMFEALGMHDEGGAIIERAQQAIVDINNQGVTFAKAGSYAEAIELLTKAADELPGNLTVTLNVLQALILQMRADGVTNQRQYAAAEYLARAERLAPMGEKVLRLRKQFEAATAVRAEQASA